MGGGGGEEEEEEEEVCLALPPGSVRACEGREEGSGKRAPEGAARGEVRRARLCVFALKHCLGVCLASLGFQRVLKRGGSVVCTSREVEGV